MVRAASFGGYELTDRLHLVAGLVQSYLDRIRAEQVGLRDGAPATYIPELANVDPESFGVALSSSDGYVYESGDTAVEFTIQSISKPFTYALALHHLGEAAVDAKVGVEPSGEAFNEISVDDVTKTPKNPMINAGAIAAVSLIPGTTVGERFDQILDFYSACAGRQLEMDRSVYASEKATGNRNRAIAYMLTSFGVLDGDPDEVLDVYFRQCSVKVTTTDLARMAATLARGGVNPLTGRRIVGAQVVRRTLSVMVTCGMYDATGDWVSAVGMPAKSGVGGGIVAVLPGQLGIGVYSPRLDRGGHSVRGVQVCRNLSAQLGLHFLTVGRESATTLRAVYDAAPRVRVYEVQGDLLFTGAEQVLRTAERECAEFDVAVLDASRVDDIDEAARALLIGMRTGLADLGKETCLVDPDGRVVSADRREDIDVEVHSTVDEAVEAAMQLVGGD